MVSAYRHIVYGEAAAATIVAPDNSDVSRLYWTTAGIVTWVPPNFPKRPDGSTTPPKPPPKTTAELLAQANRILKRHAPAKSKATLRRVK